MLCCQVGKQAGNEWSSHEEHREREREAGEKSSGKQQIISADVNKST